MRPLTASDLLGVWERGAGGTALEQALIILGAALPHVSAGSLARLTIAQRDSALLRIREATFGPRLSGLAACPACGERLELAFGADDLPPHDLPIPEEADGAIVEAGSAEIAFQQDGYEIAFRLPTSADLAALGALPDPAAARRRLLEMCITSLRRSGEPVPAAALPDPVAEALVARMEQAEPLANLTLAAACPACGHAWEILFDVVSYFWSEIDAWAPRILHEVHSLASAYGWREADILAMSAWRRQRYLELIGI